MTDRTPTFATLEREVGAWSEENFGDQPAVNPLLGVVEEFGELVDALERTDGPHEHELDCVGDMLVYLADFCHRRGYDYGVVYEDRRDHSEETVDHDEPLNGVIGALGRLHRSALKRRQGIRLDDPRVGEEAERRTVSELLGYLSEFARGREYTLEECVRLAWDEEVSDRTWDSAYVE